MEFKKLSEVYEKLEATTKRLEITDIIASFLKKVPDKELPYIVLFLMGKIFPDYDEREVGISSKLIEKAIIKVSGIKPSELQKKMNEIGDLGEVTEYFMKRKRQMTLGKRTIDTKDFLQAMEKAAKLEGSGTIKNKIDIVAGLLSHASPRDAKYIVRLIIGELRVGAGEGSVRDAISKAFNVDSKLVERAWNLFPNYGEIAFIAKTKGEEGLKNIKVRMGVPIIVQLAEKAKDLKDALDKVEEPAIEWKYDGLRTLIMKDGEKIWIFTRRLENVTKQFPELVKVYREHIKAKKAIIDSETLAVDKNGKPRPFQVLSQRIQRKYDIEKMVKEIPVRTEAFDVVYIDGKLLFELPLKERWERLKKVVKKCKSFDLARQVRTKNLKEAEKFYREALAHGQEGVMVKNLNAKYQPGRRVGYWFKVKPVMESLDLVITGATYGTGKRAGTLSSFILSCRDGDKFVEVGMMSTGIKEKKTNEWDVTYEDMTNLLKPYITSETKNMVKIMPKVVVEVEYQEIQKSPTYESGFALRFPRFVRLRQDKDPRDADTLERIKRLYKLQRGVKGKKQSER